jgi:hypothetical protein
LAPVALPAFGAAQGSAGVPAPVARALAENLAVPGGRLEWGGYKGPLRCEVERARSERPITGSGLVPLRVEGRTQDGGSCTGGAMVAVRVRAQVWVTARAIAAGEPVGPLAARQEREIRAGQTVLSELPEGATAARQLQAGTLLEPSLLADPGWTQGGPVRVVLRGRGITLVEQGRIAPCVAGRVCAVLRSGRKVEGRREGSELILEPGGT